MTMKWRLPEETSTTVLPKYALDEVLVEYEGPQIVSWTSAEGEPHLGVASDDVDGLVRWVEVALSSQAWLALMTGAQDIRGVFSNRTVLVVDRTWDLEPLRCWRVDHDELPEAALPAGGVRLPSAVTKLFSWGEARVVAEPSAGDAPPLYKLVDVLPGPHERPRKVA